MLSSAPICSHTFGMVLGMNGNRRPEHIRMLSSRLYSTAASLGIFSSLFARTHGAVSSIYLFARETTLNISSSALESCASSMSFETGSTSAAAIVRSSSSMGSAFFSSGRVPPKYLSAIATVLETRLPRSFARSVLIRPIIISLEKLQSEP